MVEERRLGIAIPLRELRLEIQDYLRERQAADDLLPYLLMSDFLEWLRRKQQKENDNGSRNNK